MSTASSPLPTIKVYRIDPRKRTFLRLLAAAGPLLLLSVAVLALTSLIRVTGKVSDGIALVGLFFFLGGGVLFYAERMRIITTPTGIEYHEPPIKIKASWDEIVGIVDTGFGYTIVWRPRKDVNKSEKLGILSKASSRVGIPLVFFMWQWKYGGLAEDVKKHAPHLFPQDHE